jgi:hypothetical protein
MAALLEKNGTDGKPIVDPGLPTSEVVHCPVRFCSISYTLAYGEAEKPTEKDSNVLDLLRRTALKKVTVSHPHLQAGDSYIWGGARLGWLNKDEAKGADF